MEVYIKPNKSGLSSWLLWLLPHEEQWSVYEHAMLQRDYSCMIVLRLSVDPWEPAASTLNVAVVPHAGLMSVRHDKFGAHKHGVPEVVPMLPVLI